MTRCPNCRSDSIRTTLKGYARGHDRNEVTCMTCGEHGFAWQWERIQELEDALFEKRLDEVKTVAPDLR